MPFAYGKFINITYDRKFVRFTLLTQFNLDILVYSDNAHIVRPPLIKGVFEIFGRKPKGGTWAEIF